MNDSKQQPDAGETQLNGLIALAERAAATIERLQSELGAQRERIQDLERQLASLQPAAERFHRMKTQLESLPEAKSGFTAHGATFDTFEEAFDAAYPVSGPAPIEAQEE